MRSGSRGLDIGGNTGRIITLVDYARQTVLITHVMDHKAYDSGRSRGRTSTAWPSCAASRT
ncbi:MAG: type II toxin-antitoxin system HigB family toxin [Tepidisphaeraceae bacterium]